QSTGPVARPQPCATEAPALTTTPTTERGPCSGSLVRIRAPLRHATGVVMSAFDLVVKGGELVDGTGTPRRRADVGVRDGRVVAIGELDQSATTVIDADGLVVAPGIVDVHTHFDAQVLWDPACTPSCLHGTTTVVSGNCGFTIAPVEASEIDYLVR